MDAQFIPFWRAGDIVRGQRRELTFKIDFARLQTSGPVVVRDVHPPDWGEFIDSELPVDGDQLTVKVPAQDFRLLAVKG